MKKYRCKFRQRVENVKNFVQFSSQNRREIKLIREVQQTLKLKFKNSDICVKFYVPLKTASPASTASLNIVLLDVSWFVLLGSLVLSVTFIFQFSTMNRMFAMDVTSTTAARSIRISFTDIVYFAYNSFDSFKTNREISWLIVSLQLG